MPKRLAPLDEVVMQIAVGLSLTPSSATADAAAAAAVENI